MTLKAIVFIILFLTVNSTIILLHNVSIITNKVTICLFADISLFHRDKGRHFNEIGILMLYL